MIDCTDRFYGVFTTCFLVSENEHANANLSSCEFCRVPQTVCTLFMTSGIRLDNWMDSLERMTCGDYNQACCCIRHYIWSLLGGKRQDLDLRGFKEFGVLTISLDYPFSLRDPPCIHVRGYLDIETLYGIGMLVWAPLPKESSNATTDPDKYTD